MNESKVLVGPPSKKRGWIGGYVWRENTPKGMKPRLKWFVGRSGSFFQMMGHLPVPRFVGNWAYERQVRELERGLKTEKAGEQA